MNSGQDGTGHRIRVLLIDDSADVRSLLRIHLERHGSFTVVAEAGDGAEGVAQAVAHVPDAVVLDLAMPVLDGLQALPGILEAAPGCRVLVFSAFGAHTAEAECLRLGAAGYVEKGTPLTEVVARLASLCEGS